MKKIRTLYIPFIGWNLIFYPIYILTYNNMNFDLVSVFKSVFMIILTVQKEGNYLGATWFLPALFWVSIAYKILDRYIVENKYKRVFILSVFIVGAVLGFSINLPFAFSRVLICAMFYAIGHAVSIYRDYVSRFDNKFMAIFAVITFGVIGYFNEVNMWQNIYKYKVLFIIGALCAIYFTIYFSRVISRMGKTLVKKLIEYIGKNSIDILIWQFVFFRIIIAIQLFIEEGSISRLLEFYPTYITEGAWWLAYTLVGVFVPILWVNFLKSMFIGKLLKKAYLIN